jgi:hypothetical protein
MSLKGKFAELNERHKRELDWQRKTASRWDADGSFAVDAVIELSSVDQTVAFFDDRLEFGRRLGSKHGTIYYMVVGAARLVERPLDSMSGPVTSTFESSCDLTKKMELTIEARRRTVVFDFRTEPIETVQGALALVKRGMSRLQTPGADVQRTLAGHRGISRADELLKLANLKSAGILTEEEFEREKNRLLGS